jgi:hypothetical protein
MNARSSQIHKDGDFDVKRHDQSSNDSDSDKSESHGSSCEHTNDGETTEPEITIAKQETRNVFRLKLLVALVLTMAAFGTAAGVYFYLSHSEEHQFLQQFKEDAHKILDAVESVLDQTTAAFDGIAVNLVSTAKMTNQTWPFVTIDDFAVRISKVLPLARALYISVYQVVQPDQREQWEEYTQSHNYWVNETMTVQKDWGEYYGSMEYNGEQNPVPYGNFGDVPRNERYDAQRIQPSMVKLSIIILTHLYFLDCHHFIETVVESCFQLGRLFQHHRT